MLVIRVGEKAGCGYAWCLDGEKPYVVTTRPGSDSNQALGALMMHLSCDEDLERVGIDLLRVDEVPQSVIDLADYGALV